MSGKTINSAILLLVIGNAMALISDVFIKLLEPGAPIFQFAFLRCVITLLLLLPLAGQLNRKHLFSGFKVHAVRAHVHLVGILCMVVALANLPLGSAMIVVPLILTGLRSRQRSYRILRAYPANG